MKKATLFYMVGYPGSGKSTFARRFAFQNNVLCLTGDKIGTEMFRFPSFSPQERQQVLKEMNRRATTSLKKGHNVLYDMCSGASAIRDEYRAVAMASHAEAVGIWVKTPPETAKPRALQVRLEPGMPPRRVTAVQFDKIVREFELPYPDELILVISGSDPFELQLKSVEAQLAQIRSRKTALAI